MGLDVDGDAAVDRIDGDRVAFDGFALEDQHAPPDR